MLWSWVPQAVPYRYTSQDVSYRYTGTYKVTWLQVFKEEEDTFICQPPRCTYKVLLLEVFKETRDAKY